MMKYVLCLSEDNRITSACELLDNGDYKDRPIVDNIPEDDVTKYRYVNGEYIYDPIPEPEPSDPEAPVAPEDDMSVWDALDAAYQEGVDSV